MNTQFSRFQEQIALYINGALSDDERSVFEQALKQNPVLKQEYKEFYEIDSVFEAIEDVTDQHFEQIFKKANLVDRTDSTQTTKESTTTPKPPPQVISTPITTETATTTTVAPAMPSPQPVPKVEELEEAHEGDDADTWHAKESFLDLFMSAKIAWGIVIAQFLLLIVLIVMPSTNGGNPVGADGKILSGENAINVVFADNATQQEIRELLVKFNAQIANGPTEIGLYTIYIKGDKNSATDAVEKLKKSNLILLAEPAFI
ncbi:hypothetical protein [Kaarinaea lacus]